MGKDYILEFYNQHSRDIYLYLLSLCHDTHIAEDLVQETFVKAMLSLDVSHNNVKGWLFRVAKNLWIDYLRKNKYSSDMDINNINIQDSSQDIINKLIKNEESAQLYKKIMTLNTSMREVITLYYFLGVDQKQIAGLMNISNGAVRTLLYRARKILKEKIEEGYGEI